MIFAHTRQAAILVAALILAACGGGASTTGSTDPGTSVSCNPADPATFDECGTILIGFTDADGDFLNYTVDVLSLTLETADGRTIEVLPRKTRINFTDYVDLTELVATVTVPPATYVAGTISFDYSDAEILVAASDLAKKTVVTDLDGNWLGQTDLRIVLPANDQLTIVRRRAALLQLDFDLEASHEVDITVTPATAALAQFIVAEVHPVDEKDIRVRGPLVEVDEDGMNYVVAIRPFNDSAGDFGRMIVNVTDDTEFEVNGDGFAGIEGLRVLSAAGPGTPTVAKGTLNVSDREFTADIVLAGSSVPGIDTDAVVGSVIARSGNFLTIRGATIIQSDDRAHFHDDVIVEVGPDTKVFKDGHRDAALSIDAISIGQRVTIRGEQQEPTTDANAPQILFDATQGAVRMHITHLLGIVNTIMPGQTDITLHAIDRRRAGIFDFSGTGPSSDLDADLDNYEVGTGNLTLAALATGRPIVAYGFPSAFGMAPPDFSGRTVIDYVDVRNTLGMAWGADGTVAPFLSMGSDGLVLDNQNGNIGIRHHVKQGPVLIDLTTLASDTTIVPRENDRTLFSIATVDSLRQYSNFDDFVADLGLSLDGATTARSMYARGQFDVDTNIFTAYKIGVYLLEP